MRAIDIATSPVVTIHPDQTVRVAAQLMDQHLVGCLIVVEQASTSVPIGVVTDRDICRSLAWGQRVDDRPVQSIMSHPPVLCGKDETLAEVVKIMRSNGLRRLPVVDQHGSLAGVITANDALTAVSELLQQLSEVLVVEPSLRDRLMASQSRLDRLQSQKG